MKKLQNRASLVPILALLGFLPAPATAWDPGLNQPGVAGNVGTVARRSVADVGAPGVGVRDPGLNQPGAAGNRGVGAPGVGVRDPGLNQPGAAGNRGVGAPGVGVRDPGLNQPGVAGNVGTVARRSVRGYR
jgi:hypothetical protein